MMNLLILRFSIRIRETRKTLIENTIENTTSFEDPQRVTFQYRHSQYYLSCKHPHNIETFSACFGGGFGISLPSTGYLKYR